MNNSSSVSACGEKTVMMLFTFLWRNKTRYVGKPVLTSVYAKGDLNCTHLTHLRFKYNTLIQTVHSMCSSQNRKAMKTVGACMRFELAL